MRRVCLLLLVIALGGCGGDDRKQSGEGCGPRHPPGAQVYRARPRPGAPVTPDRVAATVSALCERTHDRGSVHRLGGDRIELDGRAAASASHRLAFYDWEPNLLPRDQAQPTPSRAAALRNAAAQRPTPERTDIPPGGPDPAVKKRLGGDERRIEEFYDRANDAAASQPGVPRGIALVQDEARPGSSAAPGWWTLEDDAELTGDDITDPKQNFDPQTNEPIATFQFTEKGRAAFARATKREAARGAAVVLPAGADPQTAFQRFAIALDGQLVSLATIDFRANPEGIDGSTGAQINGLGNIERTRDIVDALAAPRLPLDLERVR